MGKIAELKSTEAVDDVRAEAQQALDGGMSQTELARLAGTSASTLGRWIADKYEGDNAKVARQVRSALDTIGDRQAATSALPTAPGYIETPTASRVLDTLRYAHIANDLVVIYGGAGLGKTESAKHYQANSPNVWHITVTDATSGVLAVLEEIAEALSLPRLSGPGGRPSAAALYRAVAKRMTGTYGLLIVDEAQVLSTKALDQIRQIHDATGCGLALMGNEQVYAGMTGGNRAPYLDRLYSRVGQRLRLKAAGEKDAEAIVDAWGVRAGDCRQLLLQIARTPGGLRSLTKTLRLASMYATGDRREPNCSDIRAAWKRLGGAS